MFWQIFTFELKYRIKRPATWAYFGILALFGCFIFAAGGISGSEKAHINSPFIISAILGIMSIFGILISAAVMGVPVYRDEEHKVKHYYFTYPISESGYLLGRYFGSMLILFLISIGFHVGVILGVMIGPGLGFEEPERFAAINLWHHIQPSMTIFWPNLIFTGTLFFALVALTRKVFISYVGSVLFLIGYLLAINLSGDLDNQHLAALLDPFGINAFNDITKYWTPVEQNTLVAPLTGDFLTNRLIWLIASALVLGFTLFRFDFTKFVTGGKKGKKVKGVATEAAQKNLSNILPSVNLSFSNSLFVSQLFSQGWLEFKNILVDWYFRAMIIGGVIFLGVDAYMGNKIYGTPSLPLTNYMIESKNGTYIIFVFIILIFFTGEVVHRDKTLKFSQITDALPVPNWVTYGSKFWALTLVCIFMATLVIVVGVFSQTLQGYFNYEFGKYFTDLYLLELPNYLQLTMLAFFVHIMVNKKFLGHIVSIGIWLVLFGINSIGEFNYNMALYSYRPGYRISDMNGFGHFFEAQNSFNIYWLAFGGILLLIGNLFWNRGSESSWKSRLKLAKQRYNKRTLVWMIGLLVLWIGTGAFIYNNVSVKNTWMTSKEGEKRRADFEKKYSKYKHLTQPKITKVTVNVDIFPQERRVLAKGDFVIVNKTAIPIDTLHFNMAGSRPKILEATIDGEELKPGILDTVFNYHRYVMPKTMNYGDTMLMHLTIESAHKGFPNEGFGSDIVDNGTFFNTSIFPSMGYSTQGELTSDLDRKKYDLGVKEYGLPEQTDSIGTCHLLFDDDADYVDYEAIVSTDPDQIAISPGYLQREWEENGRKYFHYKMDSPMLNFYNFCSAKYAVTKDVWKGDSQTVNIEIYHHPTHTQNIDRFIKSVKVSMDYYTQNFSPFQFRQMRILEFPRYANFAQSFANTVPYSEDFGWVGDFSDPEDTDYAFNVTAHEVAHQWWAHQVTPSATRGSNQISESMAEYAALMVLKEEYGEEAIFKFLEYEVNSYLRGRSSESKFEKTLMDNDNQAYVWYRKGGSILYALQDYITADSLNLAFANYIKAAAFRAEAPFTTTLEWFDFIQAKTPDSLRYFLDDSFHKITLYENRMKEATYTDLGNDEYEVTLKFDSQKIYYDGNGKELERGLTPNLLEIGIFAEDGKNETGMTKKMPLFHEKRWIEPGEQSMTIRVKGKPVKAGIDPYNKMIDRVSDDNLMNCEEGE